MIKLGNKPTPSGELPRIKGLGGGIGAKEVLVVKGGASQLDPGDWVVLTTGHGKTFELSTRNGVPDGTDNRDGTFVHESVSTEIGDDVEKPTLRLYNSADIVGKIRSTAGILLSITTALAIVTAGASLWFEFGGDTGPTASQTAGDAQTLLAWATEPELEIAPDAAPATIARARNELDRRRRLADACLDGRRDGSGTPQEVQGIACSPAKPPFYRDKDNAAPTAAVLGLIGALIAGIGAFRQFRPGSSAG